MEETILLEFRIEEGQIDNAPILKSELLKYDIEKCYKEVEHKINEYINAQIDYPYIKKPTLTTNYEIRYECFVPKKIDKVGDYVQKKIDAETNVKILYSDIAMALSTLSREEFTYFIECLYYKKKENYVIDKLHITRFLFTPIKNSCILKLAKTLGVAVER